MDENPYKAPQEPGGKPPPSRQWARQLRVAKPWLFTMILVASILFLVAAFVWPLFQHGHAQR